MTEAVIVAVIAAVGVAVAGVPAALIERARRENATDHAYVRHTLEAIDAHLDEIEDAVEDVSEALTNHIDDEEAHRGNTGRTEGE
jgi:predicted lipid-binding transport protein (Tim44 family)